MLEQDKNKQPPLPEEFNKTLEKMLQTPPKKHENNSKLEVEKSVDDKEVG